MTRSPRSEGPGQIPQRERCSPFAGPQTRLEVARTPPHRRASSVIRFCTGSARTAGSDRVRGAQLRLCHRPLASSHGVGCRRPRDPDDRRRALRSRLLRSLVLRAVRWMCGHGRGGLRSYALAGPRRSTSSSLRSMSRLSLTRLSRTFGATSCLFPKDAVDSVTMMAAPCWMSPATPWFSSPSACTHATTRSRRTQLPRRR